LLPGAATRTHNTCWAGYFKKAGELPEIRASPLCGIAERLTRVTGKPENASVAAASVNQQHLIIVKV
jgi:hypothetical protein